MKPIALATGLALASLATPALADGDIVCNAGPQNTWKPIAGLKKKVWQEGWTTLKMQVEGDCYEVYARNNAGQVLEAFYHPVTLEKLVVYRRGTEIYRKMGFTGK
nr:PepSY domain-containing protein [Novosphingobium profundi]